MQLEFTPSVSTDLEFTLSNNARTPMAGPAARRARQRESQPRINPSLIEEARRHKMEERAAAQKAFRISQAELADELPCSLRPGTLAHKVMGLIIDAYPHVDDRATTGTSRFSTAVRVVVSDQLTINERQRDTAVKLGIRIAECMLNRAARQLSKQASKASNSPSKELVSV